MRPFGIFLLFLAGTLLAAALLYYPAWLAIAPLGDIEPHKLLNRLAKLLALGYFFVLIRQIGMASPRALGYALPPGRFLRELTLGLAFGAAMLMALSGALLALGVRIPAAGSSNLPALLATGLLSGLAVAFIEETFFRGAVYGAIRRRASLAVAGTLSSAFYAGLHFLGPRRLPGDATVGWTTGLELLATDFHRLADPAILDSFAALFAVGSLLALVRERTGNIALCIGLHAGWVMVIKVTRSLTELRPDAHLGVLVGEYDHFIGWLAFAWVSLIAALYWSLTRPEGAA
ncbi:MAG: CPBP family intramembrane metalloprotease [Chromatiales bacterium]|jgi:membrane protease YdiL (CAAX protease family)